MATYLLINMAFLLFTFAIFRIGRRKLSKRWWAMFIALLVLTAVFDSLLVYFSFIDYNPDKILGLRIGFAPVEDFFYALYAAIIVPWFWIRFGDKNDRNV